MTSSQHSENLPPTIPPPETEVVLCGHCQRTATNGHKCKGICVADSDY